MKFSRANFIVPIPQAASFEALNAMLQERCRARQGDHAGRHAEMIGERLVADGAALRPLPAVPLEPCEKRSGRVSSTRARSRNRCSTVLVACRPACSWLRSAFDCGCVSARSTTLQVAVFTMTAEGVTYIDPNNPNVTSIFRDFGIDNGASYVIFHELGHGTLDSYYQVQASGVQSTVEAIDNTEGADLAGAVGAPYPTANDLSTRFGEVSN